MRGSYTRDMISSMKVLGISGSPHVDGNTARAVRHALGVMESEGAEARYISLADKRIAFCRSCWRCQKDRKCQIDDDMTAIVEGLRWCDGLIIGSPVYFGMVSGQLKVMMDRCVVLRPSYEGPMDMAGKIGGGIACAGFRNGGQELAIQNIHTFLMQQNMLAISDGPGFSHSGGAIAGETKDGALGRKSVENLARNMAAMLRMRVGHNGI